MRASATEHGSLDSRVWPTPGTVEAGVVANRLNRLAQATYAEAQMLVDVIDGPISSRDIIVLRTAASTLITLADDLRTA